METVGRRINCIPHYTRTYSKSWRACETGRTQITLSCRPPLARGAVGDIFEGFRHMDQYTGSQCSFYEYPGSHSEDVSNNDTTCRPTFVNPMRLNQATITINDCAKFIAMLTTETKQNYSSEIVSKIVYTQQPLSRGIRWAAVENCSPVATDKWKKNCITEDYGGEDCPMHYYVCAVNLAGAEERWDGDGDWQRSVFLSATGVVEVERNFISPIAFSEPEIQIHQNIVFLRKEENPEMITASSMTYNSNNRSFGKDCGLTLGPVNLKANQAIMTEFASKLPEPRTCHLMASKLPSPHTRSGRIFAFISSSNTKRMKFQIAFVPVRCYVNLRSQAVERMEEHLSGSLKITPIISLSRSVASCSKFSTRLLKVNCLLYTPTNLRGILGSQLLADYFKPPEREYAMVGRYSPRSNYLVAGRARRPEIALSCKIIRKTAENMLSQIYNWAESTKKNSRTQGSSTPYMDRFATSQYSSSTTNGFVVPYTVQKWISNTSSRSEASHLIQGSYCTVELDTYQMDRIGGMDLPFTERHTLNTADREDTLLHDSYVTLSNDRFLCKNLLTNQREPFKSLALPITYEQRNEIRSAPTSIKSQDQVYLRPSPPTLQGNKLCRSKSRVRSQQNGKQSEAVQSEGWHFRDQGKLKEHPKHHSHELLCNPTDMLLSTEDEVSESRSERRSKHCVPAEREKDGNSTEQVQRFGDSSDVCSKTVSLYNEGQDESEKRALRRETKWSAADSRARKKLTHDSKGRESHFKKANRRPSTSRSSSCSDASSPSFRKPRKKDRGERSQSYTRRSVKSLLRQYERLTKQLVQTNKSIVEACGRKKLRFGQVMNEYLSSTSESSTSTTQKNSPEKEVTNPTKAILKRLDKLCSTVLDVSRKNNRTAEPAVLTETPWEATKQADQLKSLFARPTLNPNLLSAGNEMQTPLDSSQSIPFGKYQLPQSQHQLQGYGNQPPGYQVAAGIMPPNDLYENQWVEPEKIVPVRNGIPAQRYHSTIPWSHRATELPLPDDTSQDDTDSHRRAKSRKRLKKKFREKSRSRRAAYSPQEDFPSECKAHVNGHQHPCASYYGSQLPVFPNNAIHTGCCLFGHHVNPVHIHSQQNMHRIQSVGSPPPCHAHHLKCTGHLQVVQMPSSSSISSRTASYSAPSYSIPHPEPCKHAYQPNLSSHAHAVSQRTTSSCCVGLQSKMLERPPNLSAQAPRTSFNRHIEPGVHVKPTSEQRSLFSGEASIPHSTYYQQPSGSYGQLINGYWDGTSSVNTAGAPTAQQSYSISESSQLPAGFCGSGLPRSPILQNTQSGKTDDKFVHQELPVSSSQLTGNVHGSVPKILQQQDRQSHLFPKQPGEPNTIMSFDGVDEKGLPEKGNDLEQAQKQSLSTNETLPIRDRVDDRTLENIRINDYENGSLGHPRTHIINQNTSHVMSSHASDQQISPPLMRSVIAMRANLASDPTTPEDWQQVEARFDKLQREKTRIEGRLCRTPLNGRENAEKVG
ncbi:hypothetical protein CRM22_004207 [Opisthorchis felineus]|uniref:Uncharacterized protein n=1 Tax=Opisthorchis felineus TaxID=147828 RepID=A0A4V3SFI5_OPIFE|nr:hypothetical protein CRM22_004207 [Opisthorchis felineus]